MVFTVTSLLCRVAGCIVGCVPSRRSIIMRPFGGIYLGCVVPSRKATEGTIFLHQTEKSPF